MTTIPHAMTAEQSKALDLELEAGMRHIATILRILEKRCKAYSGGALTGREISVGAMALKAEQAAEDYQAWGTGGAEAAVEKTSHGPLPT